MKRLSPVSGSTAWQPSRHQQLSHRTRQVQPKPADPWAEPSMIASCSTGTSCLCRPAPWTPRCTAGDAPDAAELVDAAAAACLHAVTPRQYLHLATPWSISGG